MQRAAGLRCVLLYTFCGYNPWAYVGLFLSQNADVPITTGISMPRWRRWGLYDYIFFAAGPYAFQNDFERRLLHFFRGGCHPFAVIINLYRRKRNTANSKKMNAIQDGGGERPCTRAACPRMLSLRSNVLRLGFPLVSVFVSYKNTCCESILLPRKKPLCIKGFFLFYGLFYDWYSSKNHEYLKAPADPPPPPPPERP